MQTIEKIAGPILALALGLTACSGNDGGTTAAAPTTAPDATTGTLPPSRNGTLPTFSDPTTIDNP
jgi:hypothetical protein